jgi:hypothetical protein
MFGWIKKIGKAVAVFDRAQRAAKEWQDVAEKSQYLRAKYANLAGLPDDVKDFLREVEEAGAATRDIFRI